MKQYINEAQRFQELAGLQNEINIPKAIGTAALVGASFLSPKDTKAQAPQDIEQTTQTKSTKAEAIAIGTKFWHAYDEHRGTVKMSELSNDVIKALAAAAKEAADFEFPHESVEKLGRAVKKDPAAMKVVNQSEDALRKASERGYGDTIEEIVNEALASLREEEETEEELTPDQIAVIKNIVKLSEATDGDDKAKYEKLKSELKKATLTAAFVATLITSMSSCRTGGYGCHGRESWGGMVKRINRP
jgi:hypothetical protein